MKQFWHPRGPVPLEYNYTREAPRTWQQVRLTRLLGTEAKYKVAVPQPSMSLCDYAKTTCS